MSVSTFMGLQTALRGLLAQQAAIDVTGHNVANANTAGFSRQEALLGAAPALQVSAGAVAGGAGAQLGTGVDVSAYRRVRDTFLDLQYRAQAMGQGQASTTSRLLDQAQLAFAEPSDQGIAAQLARFWSAWGDVANAPESAAARQALIDSASTLAGSFSTLDGQLATVQSQAGQEYALITGATGDVAAAARELASLNAEISAAVTAGQSPNDLLDRRDQLLDQLSQLGQVSVTDLGGGAIQVSFGDAAQPLVAGSTWTWPQTLAAPGGKLGALLDLSGPAGSIASYRADLASAARQLADSVNALHGTPFFSYTAGGEAATLSVAVGPSGVVTSTGGAPGANDIALAIAGLRGGAADGAYASLVARVGADARDAVRREANANALTAAVDDRRQSAAGVSLDEEMTNLVRFQRGYQASARTMSTMDEMLDTLINRTGRVGL